MIVGSEDVRHQPEESHQRRACCPSCDTVAAFSYSGEQRWPDQVAAAAGLSPVVTLWTCDHCHSTVNEADLPD